MRVIAGSLGGRLIKAPTGTTTRPMTDRTREAVFSMLQSVNAIEDASVLDLFAGTGALGIEALSRGAKSATFVDKDRAAVSLIKQNIADLGLSDSATVKPSEARRFLETPAHFDLAFVCPPYAFDEWLSVLARLDAALAVLESDRDIALSEQWQTVKVKRYGATMITLVRKHADERGHGD